MKDVNEKSDHIIDLDTLADKPTARRDVVLKRNGSSIGEIIELSKKDPAELTSVQSKQYEAANKKLDVAIKPLMPQIRQAMDTRLQVGKMLEGIKLPTFTFPELPVLAHNMVVPNVPPPSSATEQRKQTYLLEQLVGAFEAQNAEKDADLLRLVRPNYDVKKHLLIFSNTVIDIPENSDQEVICRALFRNGKPVSKPVDIGDVLVRLGVPMHLLKGNKKVHYAKSALNTRIAKATQVNDLLVIDKKRLWFNQKYL